MGFRLRATKLLRETFRGSESIARSYFNRLSLIVKASRAMFCLIKFDNRRYVRVVKMNLQVGSDPNGVHLNWKVIVPSYNNKPLTGFF